MRPRWVGPGLLAVAGLVAAAFPCQAAVAPSLPRSATIASNPPGSVFYALASTSTFLPLINSGEIDFGINNAVDMALSYQGPVRLKIAGRNPFVHTPNARLVMRGAPLLVGPLVRKDSPIKTMRDVRDTSYLASAGMTWDDVKVVPVPAIDESVDALVQGRADVAKEWTLERAVDPDVTLPYHPAAVQVYKERGVWSVKMDDVQRKLLALNP